MSRARQGFRIELAPTTEQVEAMGRHAGLSRFVENYALDKIRAGFAQRAAEQTYGISAAQLTKAPWSGIDLERLWRAEHAVVAPWFAESGLSSRVPKEACRLRAAGLKNWWESKTGKRKGPKVKFPKLRKRKHGSRFRYDADRAKPAGDHAVKLPGVPGRVRSREDLSWLTGQLTDGRARVIGSTVRERAGRWWVTFQLEVDRTEINTRRQVNTDAPTCGVDLGLKTFAVIVDDTGEVEEVWAADRWYPSSRTCSACGAVNPRLTLADRTWICECGIEHDRDHNAARNLLAAMRAASEQHVASQLQGDAKRLWRTRKTPAQAGARTGEAGTRITKILRTAAS